MLQHCLRKVEMSPLLFKAKLLKITVGNYSVGVVMVRVRTDEIMFSVRLCSFVFNKKIQTHLSKLAFSLGFFLAFNLSTMKRSDDDTDMSRSAHIGCSLLPWQIYQSVTSSSGIKGAGKLTCQSMEDQHDLCRTSVWK